VMPLPPDQVTAVDGIPCTTVPRTHFDLAATEQFSRRVERALDNALAMRLTTTAALRSLVADSKGRPGVRLMRELLAARGHEYVPPASELEARFLELVRAAGLPEPVRQAAVGGVELVGRVDMLWRDQRLIAELDSRRHHSARLDAANDVQRDVRAARAGYRTLRVTWEDVFTFPDATMDRLADALADGVTRRAS
jgi:very-short-patch-repair endonuclease